MKNILSITAFAVAFFITSCGKDNKTNPDNNNGNNPGNQVTNLPVNCDFAAMQAKAAMQNVGGVNYTYTVSLPGGILNPDGSWKSCIAAGTDSFSVGSDFWHGTVIHGVLIADVSKLPAINKVTVKAQSGRVNCAAQIRLCDGSNMVAETAQNNESGNVTLTLDAGNKKASKLYFYCAESVVFSITIE